MIEVDTLNPTELLRRFNAPELIDFLSLDVEVREYEVLSALDLLNSCDRAHDDRAQSRLAAAAQNSGLLGSVRLRSCPESQRRIFLSPVDSARLSGGSGRIVDPMTVFKRVYRTYGINEPGANKLTSLCVKSL